MSYKLYPGDARQILPKMETESVHLVCTSPPYWTIKEYSGKREEIGAHQELKDYLHDMDNIFQECTRVLHSGCYMAVNIGDQFVSSAQGRKFRIIPLSSYFVRLMATIPTLDYMGTITWNKVSNTTTSGGGAIMGSTYLPRDGHFLINKEYIHFFRKAGKSPSATDEQKAESEIKPWERKLWFRSDWSFPGEQQVDHQAPFPIELPYRVTRMRTYFGETVLDPFAGTGTTLAAAKKAGREAIGIELGWTNDDKWKKVIENKVNKYGKRVGRVSSRYSSSS